jgi:hypothetical protein
MVLEGSTMSSSLKHRKLRNGRASTADSRVTPRKHVSASIVPHGADSDFIDQTVAIWQPQTTRQLNREDGREIIENMIGFFRVLQEWDRTERAAKSATK